MGIQLRLFSWLVVVALPVVVACVFTVHVVETHLTEKVIAGLENDHRLESARIESALDNYLQHAFVLAHEAGVRDALSTADPAQLGEAAEYLLRGAQMFKSGVTNVRLDVADGSARGQTSGYSWEPAHPEIVQEAIRSGTPKFGDAFLDSSGVPSLGVIVPVFDDQPDWASLIGYLSLEMRLGPIVDLVVAHEGLGETSESHIAQPTAEGDAQFITLMRFKRDAAFNFTVPKRADKPINWSLESPQMRVVREPDYRSVDSMLAIGTIASTGWGLVVKIDSAEAFGPLTEIKRLIWAAGAASVLLIMVSWLVMLRPMARRLGSISALADRMAAGDYACAIEDSVTDEVGRLAASINRLASDLARDQALRHEAERNLKHHAEHDALTGLFNRRHLETVVSSWDDTGERVCSVLFLDLDGFKPINDEFGHHVGDEILASIAREVKKCMPDDALVARWGGDEFVVLVPDVSEAEARQLRHAITARFAQAFSTSAGDLTLGCSIGISSTDRQPTLRACIAQADVSMYRAKERRKRKQSMDGEKVRFVRESLLEKRVEVFYQPIIDIEEDAGDQRLVGAEALVRIRDRDGALLTPGAYLDDLRISDISSTLDKCVLAQALADFAHWRDAGLIADDFYLGVNLCGRTARAKRLPAAIEQMLEAWSLPAHHLYLELAEEAGELDTDVLSAIKSLGVGLSIDNVSLLHSNFMRLTALAPKYAKFDQDWVGELADGADTDVSEDVQSRRDLVLGHMIKMCDNLGVETMVEGVESERQLMALRALGLRRFQGFLFDEALSSTHFLERLQRSMRDQDSDYTAPIYKAG